MTSVMKSGYSEVIVNVNKYFLFIFIWDNPQLRTTADLGYCTGRFSWFPCSRGHRGTRREAISQVWRETSGRGPVHSRQLLKTQWKHLRGNQPGMPPMTFCVNVTHCVLVCLWSYCTHTRLGPADWTPLQRMSRSGQSRPCWRWQSWSRRWVRRRWMAHSLCRTLQEGFLHRNSLLLVVFSEGSCANSLKHMKSSQGEHLELSCSSCPPWSPAGCSRRSATGWTSCPVSQDSNPHLEKEVIFSQFQELQLGFWIENSFLVHAWQYLQMFHSMFTTGKSNGSS